MLTLSDLIVIPYTPDLTQAGVHLACRSLAKKNSPEGRPITKSLREIVARTAVELAFRRLINQRRIHHSVIKSSRFMTPESYVLSLGGRRCEFIIAQILNKSHIRNFRCQPERLLQVRQSIPSSKLFSELAKGSDIFIFAFLNALVTNSRKEIERALAAGQPCFLFYSLPINWTLPNLTSIGNLIVKAGTKNPVTFELGGLDKEQNYQTERIDLEPGHFARSSLEYHSLAFVRAHHLPNGRVDVHS